MVAFDQPVFLFHAVDLEHLAAETDHQRAAEIGMRRVAPLGPPQHVEALAVRGKPAAGAVHECHHAIDLRMIREQAGALHLARDEARRRRRTVHRCQNADVVARAGLAAGARVAFERLAQL